MHVKIYFNEKPVYLADSMDDEVQALIHHDDTVFIDELSPPGINTLLHEIRQPRVRAGVYLHSDLAKLKKAFFKKFVLVQAAGGLVRNEKKDILVMFRRNKWDLPKGKLDRGETLEQCAMREVQEETGIQHLVLLHPLTITYHTYDESGRHVLKESHWYEMTAHSNSKLVPQTGEDITEVKWVSTTEIKALLPNAFLSVRDVLAAASL